MLFVIDGVGGLPHPDTGLTELETAKTPNLDSLAERGITGMSQPVAPGIAPGSGVAHLALFGYDPIKHAIGRGAVAAYGMGLTMNKGDVAFRFNFAGFGPEGQVLDRRAGRLATEKNRKLCKLLRQIELPGIDIIIDTVLDYRGVVIFKGDGLDHRLSESDPQNTGDDVFPKQVEPLVPEASRAADLANAFIKAANEILRDGAKDIAHLPDGQHIGILTRGFADKPEIPRMQDLYNLKKMGAIATYPDYRGVARIAGMDIVYDGHDLSTEFDALENVFDSQDFIFFHVKKTDSTGEDGNFHGKVQILEEVDKFIPRLEALDPDVIVIAGDHSTPATYKKHSWHPVPFALVSKWCRPDNVRKYCESECTKGAMGLFPATEIMLYALGHAERTAKFGA